MVGGSLKSWQHVRSYHVGHQLVTVDTDGMTGYPTQSHYPDTESTGPWCMPIMPSAWLGNDKYEFGKSSASLDWELNS